MKISDFLRELITAIVEVKEYVVHSTAWLTELVFYVCLMLSVAAAAYTAIRLSLQLEKAELAKIAMRTALIFFCFYLSSDLNGDGRYGDIVGKTEALVNSIINRSAIDSLRERVSAATRKFSEKAFFVEYQGNRLEVPIVQTEEGKRILVALITGNVDNTAKEKLKDDGWKVRFLFYAFSLSSVVLQVGEIVSATIDLAVKLALQLTLPLILLYAFVPTLQQKYVNDAITFAVMWLFIYPLVFVIIQFIALSLSLIPLELGAKDYWQVVETADAVVIQSTASPLPFLAAAAIVSLIAALMIFATPFIAYGVITGRIGSTMIQTTSAWLTSIMSTAAQTAVSMLSGHMSFAAQKMAIEAQTQLDQKMQMANLWESIQRAAVTTGLTIEQVTQKAGVQIGTIAKMAEISIKAQLEQLAAEVKRLKEGAAIDIARATRISELEKKMADLEYMRQAMNAMGAGITTSPSPASVPQAAGNSTVLGTGLGTAVSQSTMNLIIKSTNDAIAAQADRLLASAQQIRKTAEQEKNEDVRNRLATAASVAEQASSELRALSIPESVGRTELLERIAKLPQEVGAIEAGIKNSLSVATIDTMRGYLDGKLNYIDNFAQANIDAIQQRASLNIATEAAKTAISIQREQQSADAQISNVSQQANIDTNIAVQRYEAETAISKHATAMRMTALNEYLSQMNDANAQRIASQQLQQLASSLSYQITQAAEKFNRF